MGKGGATSAHRAAQPRRTIAGGVRKFQAILFAHRAAQLRRSVLTNQCQSSLFPDRNFYVTVVMPFYLQRRFRIIDILIAYILAGSIVDLREGVFVDV